MSTFGGYIKMVQLDFDWMKVYFLENGFVYVAHSARV